MAQHIEYLEEDQAVHGTRHHEYGREQGLHYHRLRVVVLQHLSCKEQPPSSKKEHEGANNAYRVHHGSPDLGADQPDTDP
eukprot:CAMPEP_0114159490 /NCGR_PEP_ID=MMETSP0043_2-20121206/27813_1 /TAXON_ID=464988 /ORGANISM="Hemiselmis andersenii, Strain CCMP644" /LENGTH=79 /DNA_ID=CAMNT_0001255389 /DNA_START=369 /DNA_END=608 /DNA_ORIENTATION=+